jgi:hypothetical protein
MDSTLLNTHCKTGDCHNSAVIGLAGQEVCLDHFFAICYEHLDTLEKMVCERSLNAAEVKSALNVLRECSNRALLISFRLEFLSNLERSRLLDILLSCGDLQLLLSQPHLQYRDSPRRAPVPLS